MIGFWLPEKSEKYWLNLKLKPLKASACHPCYRETKTTLTGTQPSSNVCRAQHLFDSVEHGVDFDGVDVDFPTLLLRQH